MAGRAVVAFDSYRSGSYDVFLWSGGRLRPVAATSRFEARPTLAVDPRGRAWVAYEERDANWGKDSREPPLGKGFAAVSIGVGEGPMRRRRPGVRCPRPGRHAPASLRALNGYPRIAADRDGRIWLAFRHRLEAIWGGPAVMVVGGTWIEYVTALAGPAWEPPRPLPRSDGLLDNRPALVMPADGQALIFYSSDGRLRREIEFTPERDIEILVASRDAGRP